MRFLLPLALLALALLPPRHANAQAGDILFDHNLAFSGQIIQEVANNGSTTISSITPAHVLQALALTSTAGKLKFYFDSTANSYVIAPTGIQNGNPATPIATLLSLAGTNNIQWTPTVNSSFESGSCSGLDGGASGSFADKGVIAQGTETYAIQFILSGTLTGLPTILEGKLTDIFHP